jgi:hypothetical protein
MVIDDLGKKLFNNKGNFRVQGPSSGSTPLFLNGFPYKIIISLVYFLKREVLGTGSFSPGIPEKDEADNRIPGTITTDGITGRPPCPDR